MRLIKYPSLKEFLQDVYEVIEGNFISHYLLFLATDRVLQRTEEIYYGSTIKSENQIEIVHMYTEQGHYFFGLSKNKLAVQILAQSINDESFTDDRMLLGSTFIINELIKIKSLHHQNDRHRYYMAMNIENGNEFEGNTQGLHVATQDNFEDLKALQLEFYEEEFEGKGLQSSESILAQLRNSLRSPGTFFWKNNSDITTIVSVEELPEKRAYVPNIYTRKGYRRNGFSRSTLQSVIHSYAKEGFKEIGLNVKVKNTPAINLFRSVGMSIIYETGVYVTTPAPE